MSLLGRLTETIAGKMNAVLDRFDEPGEALDYAYQLELEQLLRVRRAVMDVAASQRQLASRSEQLRAAVPALERLARDELSLGREDAAREALARRVVLGRGLEQMAAQAETIGTEEERFARAADRLDDKVGALAATRAALKARYAATGSRADIDQVVSELRDEVREIDAAVRRAEARVAEVGERTAGIDRLLASGALYDLSRPPPAIEAELDPVRRSDEVADELARIRRSS